MSKKVINKKIDSKLITKCLYVAILLIGLLCDDYDSSRLIYFCAFGMFCWILSHFGFINEMTLKDSVTIFFTIDLFLFFPSLFLMELSLIASVVLTPILSDYLSLNVVIYLICINIIFLTAYILSRFTKIKYYTKKGARLRNIVLLLYFIGFLLSGLLPHIIRFIY